MNLYCILLLGVLGFNQCYKIRVRRRWYPQQIQIPTQTVQQSDYHIPFYLYEQGSNGEDTNQNLVYFVKRKPVHWATNENTEQNRLSKENLQMKYDIDKLQANSENRIDSSTNINGIDKSETNGNVGWIIDDTDKQREQDLINTEELLSEDAKTVNSRDRIQAEKQTELNTETKGQMNPPVPRGLFNYINIGDIVKQIRRLLNLESSNEPDEDITSKGNGENENRSVENGINANSKKSNITVSSNSTRYFGTANDEAIHSAELPAEKNKPVNKIIDNRHANAEETSVLNSLTHNKARQKTYKISVHKVNFGPKNILPSSEVVGPYFIGENGPILPKEYSYRNYLDPINIQDEEYSDGAPLRNNYPSYPDIANFKRIKGNSIDKTKVNLANEQREDDMKYLVELISKTNYGTNPYNRDDEKGHIIYVAPSGSLDRIKIDDIVNKRQFVNFGPINKVNEVTSNGNRNYDINEIDANQQKYNFIVSPKSTKYVVTPNAEKDSEGDLMKVIGNKNEQLNSMDDDINVKSEENWSLHSSNTVDHNKESWNDVDKNSMKLVKDIKLNSGTVHPVPKNFFATPKLVDAYPINQNIANEENTGRFIPRNYAFYPGNNNLWRMNGYSVDPKVNWENKWMKQIDSQRNYPFDYITNTNIVNKRYSGDEIENSAPCNRYPSGYSKYNPQKNTEWEGVDTNINQPNRISKIRRRDMDWLIKYIGGSALPLQIKTDILLKALNKSQKTNLLYNTLSAHEPIDAVSNVYEYNINKVMSSDGQIEKYNDPEKQILDIQEMNERSGSPDSKHGAQEISNSEEDINFRSLKSTVKRLFDNPEDEPDTQTSSPSISSTNKNESNTGRTGRFDILREENANDLTESVEVQQNKDLIKPHSDSNTFEILKPQDVTNKNYEKITKRTLPDSPIIYIPMSPDSKLSHGKKSSDFRNDYDYISRQSAVENAIIANIENSTKAPDAHKADISDASDVKKNLREKLETKHDTTEIAAANNTDSDDWIEILVNALSSKLYKIPTTADNELNQSSHKVLEEKVDQNSLEHIQILNDRKQSLIQILKVMIPDLLKLYNTCQTQSNEELLKGWKILIESMLEKQCEIKAKN